MGVAEEEGNSHLIPWATEGAVAAAVAMLPFAVVLTTVVCNVPFSEQPIMLLYVSLIYVHPFQTRVSLQHADVADVLLVAATAVVGAAHSAWLFSAYKPPVTWSRLISAWISQCPQLQWSSPQLLDYDCCVPYCCLRVTMVAISVALVLTELLLPTVAE